jgi:signal transduction histidine kinase
LRRIADNATRLDKLILDVLTFTRISRAEIPLERVCLERLVGEVIQHYSALQEPQAVVELTPLLDVMGHEPSLTQVVSNLLVNAVKFVRPGVRPRVRIWTEPRGIDVRLWVEDNGIGIPPEYQHRLFKMFERLHPGLKHEGTGVGLAIVRKAAERMGGQAGVESDGLNGSRFWVQLRGAAPLAGAVAASA